MIASISPFWDGNETWLVVIGASLFAAFPAAYAVFLPAFYIPVLLLLFGLIFRGVAFEFRHRTERYRWLWDWGFFLGSAVVGFVQGAAVGAMIEGIPVVGGQYAGGPFEWLAPFPILCGIGLVLGYCLLGASWLVLKNDGELRNWAYRRIPWLVGGVAVVLAIAFVITFDIRNQIESSFAGRTWGAVFLAIGALAVLGILAGVWRRRDGWPFVMTTLFFLSAFLTLAVMFWPYMIPYSVTVANAAAPEESLHFLFYGAGIVVLPVIIIYTAAVYWIFRGKLRKGYS
jgi:cytochrome d ubiquinol oxidase subunit II